MFINYKKEGDKNIVMEGHMLISSSLILYKSFF